MTNNNIPIPTESKMFRRILDIIIESADDDINEMAEFLIAESGTPIPDPEIDIEIYDKFIDEVLSPMQDQIWIKICDALSPNKD